MAAATWLAWESMLGVYSDAAAKRILFQRRFAPALESMGDIVAMSGTADVGAFVTFAVPFGDVYSTKLVYVEVDVAGASIKIDGESSPHPMIQAVANEPAIFQAMIAVSSLSVLMGGTAGNIAWVIAGTET